MLFYGFKTNIKTMAEFEEKIINKSKSDLKKQLQKTYNELLSKEIQIMVDEIATNVYERPEKTIFAEAVDLLNKKIAVSSANNYDTEYNMSSAFNIFQIKGETFVELATFNDKIYQIISENDNLINMSIGISKDEKENRKREALWNDIIKQYKDHSCLMIKLSPLGDFAKPEFKDLHFTTIKERAYVIARNRLANNYLSMYAGGGNIPNYKLMEYMEQTFLKLSDSRSAEKLEEYQSELIRILPEITEEMVFGPKQTSDSDKET